MAKGRNRSQEKEDLEETRTSHSKNCWEVGFSMGMAEAY